MVTDAPPVLLGALLLTAIYALCVVRWVLRADPSKASAPVTASASKAAEPVAASSAKAAAPTTTAGGETSLTVFYASQKGHCLRFANRLSDSARARGVKAVTMDLALADPDRMVEHRHAAFIVATYAGGSAVPGTEGFFHEMTEMSRDFRVEKTLLSNLTFAVFGAGNSEYPAKDFNAAARRLDRALRLLGGRRLLSRREGDDIDNALTEQFEAWLPTFWEAFERSASAGDKLVAKGVSKAKARRLDKMMRQVSAETGG